MLKRWIGPALLTLAAMGLFQWFAVPILSDLRDDWGYLHDARQGAIQRLMQQQRQKE